MDPNATLLNSCYHARSVAEVCLNCERGANACPNNGCAEYRRACREAARPIKRTGWTKAREARACRPT